MSTTPLKATLRVFLFQEPYVAFNGLKHLFYVSPWSWVYLRLLSK